MRYFLDRTTLFLRGSFTAAATGACGGFGRVSTLFCATRAPRAGPTDPGRERETLLAQAGYSCDAFGLFSTAEPGTLCVLQYDFITAFVMAGLPEGAGDGQKEPSVSLILCSSEGLGEGALLEAIAAAAEAKAEVLAASGHPRESSSSCAVIAASEGPRVHTFAGAESPVGSRVQACVKKGIEEALRRSSGEVVRNRPSFFIYSRFGNGHWVEWMPEDCPYYPCHYPGQRCDFCYCPFYPCHDETLGQWAVSSQGGQVWNCAACTLLHEPDVADYLARNPEASLAELVRFRSCREKRA